jgi:N-acetylglucosaminyldiphosphoundecaprenol N-acetyl-beta-D-mannosaminyltransferase
MTALGPDPVVVQDFVPAAPPGGRVDILGVGIDAVDLGGAVARVRGWIDQRHLGYAIFCGVHGVVLCQDDSRLKRAHLDAGLVGPDGMPLVWLCRGRGRRAERIYGPDFMLAFCRQTAVLGYRHYFYGATPDTLDRLVRRLQTEAPDLTVAGRMSPPFRDLDPAEEAQIVAEINAAGADVIWIGLSTPKQELWMARHRGRLTAPALLGVGAAFDFNAGVKAQAPRWMRSAGLEWAFRACSEPRRLGARYAYIIPRFAGLLALQALGLVRLGRGRAV